VDRPVGVRPPDANGGTSSVFLNLDRLESNCVDRAGPLTVRVWTGPVRLQTLVKTNENTTGDEAIILLDRT
jgi:hypothetical protein